MSHSDEHQILLDKGLRPTRSRLQVLGLLRTAPPGESHWSVENIYRHMMRLERNPTMATIYRVLGEFEQRGLVARHRWGQGQGAALFELTRSQHHHLVCTESGAVTEFTDTTMTSYLQQLSRERDVELVDYDLVVYTRPRSA